MQLSIRHRVIVILIFFFSLTAPNFAVSYFSIGLESGYGPNAMGMKDGFDLLKQADERIFQKAVETRDYYGDRVKITDLRTDGGELSTMPFGLNLRFIYNRLFFKFSFLNHVIPVNRRSYVLNTKPGVDSTLATTGAANNFYSDYYKNQDGDLSNDVKLAYGLIPTNGENYFFQSTSVAQVLEIPFTVGFILIGKEFYKFYIGAGVTFFTGRTSRTITVSKIDGANLSPITGLYSQADIDEFSGNATGFHFMMGSEFQVTSKVGLYMEFTYSIGAAVPLEDRIRTGSNTVLSLFTSNDSFDMGGAEVPGSVTKPGLPRVSGLNFEYIRLTFGLSYHLLDNTPSRVIRKKRNRLPPKKVIK